MIIELVGLPGSGKTTLAGKLGDRGAAVIRPPKGFRLLFESFRYFLRNPLRFLRIATATARVTPARLRFTLLLNLVLVHAAKTEMALNWSRKGRVAVIDQGFFQNLLAAFDQAPPEEELLAYARLLPRPDLLLVVSTTPEERERQLAERGRRPREEFGPKAAEALEAVAKESAEKLGRIASELLVPHETGTAAALSGINLPDPPFKAPAFRQFLKQLSFGLLYALRSFAAFGEERVVLMYHAIEHSSWRLAVTPRAFERQMAYLARHKLAASLSAIVDGTAGKRTVAVTFDDGYRDLMTVVRPVVERYRIPITVFVTSDLSSKTDRDGRPRLSLQELKELAASPLVRIESHAKTHRKLTELSDKEAEGEARESREELAALIGKRPEYLAYPYGARNAGAERAVEAAGYAAAFGITDGLVTRRSPRYALPRVQVDATMTPLLFRARLTRAVAWHHRLFHP